MGASAPALTGDIHHEAAHTATGFGCSAPVVVVCVVTTLAVALGPQFLNEGVRAPALEGAGTLFDAFYRLGAWEGCFFGVSDRGVEGFVARSPDRAGGEVGFAR